MNLYNSEFDESSPGYQPQVGRSMQEKPVYVCACACVLECVKIRKRDPLSWRQHHNQALQLISHTCHKHCLNNYIATDLLG